MKQVVGTLFTEPLGSTRSILNTSLLLNTESVVSTKVYSRCMVAITPLERLFHIQLGVVVKIQKYEL